MTRPLPLAIRLLTPTVAPPTWIEAVAEAVRLLAPSWDGSPVQSEELSTLALVLFARTHTGDRAPQEVSLEEILTALDVPEDGMLTREPAVRGEIDSALTDAGLTSGLSPESSPLWRIYWNLCEVYRQPMHDDFEPEAPSPSPMRHCIPDLARHLAVMTEEARSGLEPVPVEAGALRVDTTRVMMVNRHSQTRLDCPDRCPPEAGGHLVVDGPDATWVCGNGHRTLRPGWLSAAHARNALRRLGIDPAAQGRVDAGGPFYVPVADAPEDADFAKLFALPWFEPLEPLAGRDHIVEDVIRIVDERQSGRG